MSSVPSSSVSGRLLQIGEGECRMSESDNFILRWARLKREAQIDHEVSDDNSPKDLVGPQRSASVEPEATPAQPRLDAADSEAFDPSSLPSIETITAET